MYKWGILFCIILLVGGCASTSQGTTQHITVGSHQYTVFNEITLIEQTLDSDSHARFGVLADIQPDGEYGTLEQILARMHAENVEFLLVLGDLVQGNAIDPKQGTSDEEELRTVLTLLGETGVPVFFMPGNHEEHDVYYSVVNSLSYNNLFDLSRLFSLSLDDIDILALPGYHDPRFMPVHGFRYSPDLMAVLSNLRKSLNNPVLISHGPPRTHNENGIDYVPGVGNVGDTKINTFMKQENIHFSLSGHIHEAGQRAVNAKGELREAGVFHDSLYLNAAAVVDGYASIVTFEDNTMRFETVSIQ